MHLGFDRIFQKEWKKSKRDKIRFRLDQWKTVKEVPLNNKRKKTIFPILSAVIMIEASFGFYRPDTS